MTQKSAGRSSLYWGKGLGYRSGQNIVRGKGGGVPRLSGARFCLHENGCIMALVFLVASKIMQSLIQNMRCFFFSIFIFRKFRILGKSTSQKLHRKGTTLGPKSDYLPNPDRKKSDPNEENGPAKCEKMGRPKIKTRRPKIKTAENFPKFRIPKISKNLWVPRRAPAQNPKNRDAKNKKWTTQNKKVGGQI